MSPVFPGEVYRFTTSDLELTLLVVSVDKVFNADCALTTVLLLDLARTVNGFRADVGQTTDWCFNRQDLEWERLQRVS